MAGIALTQEQMRQAGGHVLYAKRASDGLFTPVYGTDDGALLQAMDQRGTYGNVDLGYEQTAPTDIAAAKTLAQLPVSGPVAIPAAALAVINVNGGAVRWRTDGVAPANGVGNLLNVGEKLTLPANLLATFKVIEDVAGNGAYLDINYFG